MSELGLYIHFSISAALVLLCKIFFEKGFVLE